MTHKNPIKILFNYDYSLAPMTTAYYFEQAAQKNKQYRAYRTGQIAPHNADAIINFETCDEIITSPLIPSAYYEIDNHLIEGKETWNYDPVDIVYIAQEINNELYPAHKTKILPLAADPDLHKPIPNTRETYDIGFIGNDTYPERNAMLKMLGRNFNLMRATTAAGLAYSLALSKCKLAFNCSLREDVNMRFYEAQSCGKCLLTDRLPENLKYGKPGSDYVEYSNETELFTKVKMLLSNPALIKKIGKNARQNIIANHTYNHRLNTVIDDLLKIDKSFT